MNMKFNRKKYKIHHLKTCLDLRVPGLVGVCVQVILEL